MKPSDGESDPKDPRPVCQQHTSSENSINSPVLIAFRPSIFPTAEKAQQLPHSPWFLTGVTAPFFRQSTLCSDAALNTTQRRRLREGGREGGREGRLGWLKGIREEARERNILPEGSCVWYPESCFAPHPFCKSLGDVGFCANTERFRVSVPLLPHLCLLSAL